jgi:hypothetical protein
VLGKYVLAVCRLSTTENSLTAGEAQTTFRREPRRVELLTNARLSQYVALAVEMSERAQETVDRATELLRQSPDLLSFRDRVMIGFTLKMLSNFRALIDDAHAARAETMHHY